MKNADLPISIVADVQEQLAAAAFTKQSAVFDETFSGNPIIQYKRERVRNSVQRYLPPESRILELNCGTGEDAIWFAGQGHRVHATDLSTGMLEVLREKLKTQDLQNKISTELRSFTELTSLNQRGPYDLIFSNFGGLNCTGKLNTVLNSFDSLLKPGGLVVLVVLSKFCLWETLLLFKGKFRTAFRRFFSSHGVKAKVEGSEFTCWYYNPSQITGSLKNNFNLLRVEGLCTLVPPSYIEQFTEKHPGIYSNLKTMEDRLKSKWPWRVMGDYFIISLQKRQRL